MASYNLAVAAKSPDMKVAAAHWVYMSAARYGAPLRADADRLLKREVLENEEIIENEDYFKLIRLYKGKLSAATLLAEIDSKSSTLSSASLGYGLGNWYWYNGDKLKAMDIWRKITAGDQWSSFGFIAAEAELKR